MTVSASFRDLLEPALADQVERVFIVRTDARSDGDLRMSGLQLPEGAETGGNPAASRTLSVNQTTSYRWSLEEDLVGYLKAEIAGIGLYRPKVGELAEDAAIDLIRASGLAVSSLSWIGGFTGSDGSRIDEALFDAGEAVRFAAAVGAGTIGVIGGGSGGHIAVHARRLLVDALKGLCDDAGEVDVRLALHPLSSGFGGGRSILNSLDQTLDVLTAVNRPNLGLVFDVGQFGGESGIAGRIRSVVSLVHVVRLSDRRGRRERRRQRETALSAATVVQTFFAAGYDGPFEFDLWNDSVASPNDYAGVLAGCRTRFESFAAADEPAI